MSVKYILDTGKILTVLPKFATNPSLHRQRLFMQTESATSFSHSSLFLHEFLIPVNGLPFQSLYVYVYNSLPTIYMMINNV